MNSNRHKKRLVQQGVERLRRKQGWDPAKVVRQSAQDKLQQLDQDSRNHSTYEASQDCPACIEARRESGDDTALCDHHLSKAMGF